jgi:hypothetical protein
MRKLILKRSMSLDGFVSGPNDETGWIFESASDETTAWLVKTLSAAGLHIMGSRTFHDMVNYWPTSHEPIAAPMNAIPKMVFSRKGLGGQADATTRSLQDASHARAARGEAAAAAPVGLPRPGTMCRCAAAIWRPRSRRSSSRPAAIFSPMAASVLPRAWSRPG